MTKTIDSDRVSLSNELLSLAETFAIEATLWATGCKAELERNARLLATIGRSVLTTGDIEKADAFARAGRTIIGNVQGTRRFFGTVLTPPTVNRKRYEGGRS